MTSVSADERRRRERARQRVPHAFGLVLLGLGTTYLLGSLINYRGVGGVVITTTAALSGTLAFAAAQAGPRVLVWASRLGALAVAFSIVAAISGTQVFFGLTGLSLAVLLAASALAVLRAVLTQQRVGFRTILGAVCVYVTLGLLFAFAYVGIDRFQGGPFFGPGVNLASGDYLFFSMTTLTTTGYGDLVPAGQPGKLVAVLEMLSGQIFLVTLIARLVSMWSPGQWLQTHEAVDLESPDMER
jgi:voltage-gated potassium channel Kch